MKTQKSLRLRASVLAVHGALVFMGTAHAERPIEELTKPQSSVEVGVGTNSSYAAQAEQYSGVSRKGPFLIGNFELEGGGAFDSEDPTRWFIRGDNLGLKSRSLNGEFGKQGVFRLKLGYEELLRNTTDSYQTPYTGVGTNVLMLPANWVTVVVPRVSTTTPNARGLSPDVTNSSAIVAGVLTPPTPAQLAQAAALQAADLPAFHRVDLFTKRTNFGASWEQIVNTRWSFNLSLSDEHKRGLKELGAHSHATGGDVSSFLPIPIDQDDYKSSVGVSYTGDALQLQASFDVSSFKNNVPSVTWNLWSGPTNVATMSTMPSNLFHKFLVSANYQFSPSTKVAASVATTRLTQNQPFVLGDTALPAPVNSLNGQVRGESASLKLSNRTTKDLSLSAGLKYDDHVNTTPINTYVFYDNQEAPSGVSPFRYLFPTLPNLGTDVNIAANTPYSYRITAADLDAEYKLRPGNRVKVGLKGEKTHRWCQDAWAPCVNATDATENTLHADWYGQLTDSLQAQVGLAGSKRKVDPYDENSFLARVPMANQFPTGAPAGTTAYSAMLALGLNGYGPVLGLNPAAPAGSALAFYFPLNNPLANAAYGFRNRISELLGMRRYDQADRDRNKLHTAVTFQPTEKLELQGGVDFSEDKYKNSVYGLTKSSTGAVNLDATYTLSDDFSVNAFASVEQQHFDQAGNTFTANSAAASVNGATAIQGGCFATIALRNASNKIDPCLDWTSSTRDRTTTLGLAFTKSKLMAGKVSVTGAVAYSVGKTDIDVTGGSYVNNPYAGIAGNPSAAIAAYFIPATPLPTTEAKSLELTLAGKYSISKNGSVRVAYGFKRLRSTDWAYEGMQDGSIGTFLPTREQAPTYDVHTIGISYVVSFY